jgi:hypothetical protein
MMNDEQRRRLKRILKDGFRIQDRFSAEPMLGPTGKGYLKSEGVETLQRIKAGMKRSAERKAQRAEANLKKRKGA